MSGANWWDANHQKFGAYALQVEINERQEAIRSGSDGYRDYEEREAQEEEEEARALENWWCWDKVGKSWYWCPSDSLKNASGASGADCHLYRSDRISRPCHDKSSDGTARMSVPATADRGDCRSYLNLEVGPAPRLRTPSDGLPPINTDASDFIWISGVGPGDNCLKQLIHASWNVLVECRDLIIWCTKVVFSYFLPAGMKEGLGGDSFKENLLRLLEGYFGFLEIGNLLDETYKVDGVWYFDWAFIAEIIGNCDGGEDWGGGSKDWEFADEAAFRVPIRISDAFGSGAIAGTFWKMPIVVYKVEPFWEENLEKFEHGSPNDVGCAVLSVASLFAHELIHFAGVQSLDLGDRDCYASYIFGNLVQWALFQRYPEAAKGDNCSGFASPDWVGSGV